MKGMLSLLQYDTHSIVSMVDEVITYIITIIKWSEINPFSVPFYFHLKF